METVSYHDKELLGKISSLCEDRTLKFEKALTNADGLEIVDLFYEGLISHIEDLTDEIESPEIKAEVIIFTTEFKVNLKKMSTIKKAERDFMEGKS